MKTLRDCDTYTFWDHGHFMEQALLLAEQSQGRGDQGVGAIVVFPSGQTVAEGDAVGSEDPLAHAEMMALRKALVIKPRLHGCMLYSTCEPCAMCAAAAVECGIREVVFGAFSGSHGFASARFMDLTLFPISYQGGVLAEQCLRHLSSKLLETAYAGEA